MEFRKDINGLRALAVIAVVIFHFNPSLLAGGFAGVDVFFVISGFLMTGIIFNGLEKNNFSILRFYIARANRIIPALAVLCFAILFFGWFYLEPADYRKIGVYVASSMGFVSNFIYWFQSGGYFDPSSHEKWLLHTWSLSVEWQFYIIYPLIIVSLKNCVSIHTLKLILVVTTIVSFMVGAVLTYIWPDASYYLLSARMWEMLLGGIAFLFPLALSEKRQKILELVGFFLICGSYFFISKDNLWPGYLALFPTLGTYFIIQSQRFDSQLTGNRLFQTIGKGSYSIYLWHWPVVVILNYLMLRDTASLFIGVLLSFTLGFISYYLIENKLLKRLKKNNKINYALRFSLISVACLCILGADVYVKNGYQSRLNESVEVVFNGIVMPNRKNGFCFYDFDKINDLIVGDDGLSCHLGDKSKKSKILLFGDSFAGQYEPFWDLYLKQKGRSFKSITTNWCSPSLSKSFVGAKGDVSYKQCLINRQYVQANLHLYSTIIISGMWSSLIEHGYFKETIDLVKLAEQQGVNVIIMPQPHYYDMDVGKRFRTFSFNPLWPFSLEDIPSENDVLAKYANDLLLGLADSLENVEFIKRKDIFEDEDQYIENNMHIPYSLDGGHISMIGSQQSAQFYLKQNNHKEIRNMLLITK